MDDSYIIAIIAALLILVALSFFAHRRYSNLSQQKQPVPWYILLGNYAYYLVVLFVIVGLVATPLSYYTYGQDLKS